MSATCVQRTIEAVWRMESAKIIARLARMLNQVGIAEELAHDALVSALEQWPTSGVPDNPAAWLMTAAKHRALEGVGRRRARARPPESIAHEAPLTGSTAKDPEEAADDDIGNDLLRLMF